MKDIKCPSCGKTFRIDPSSFEEILLQIKDEEFNKQIKERLILAEEDNTKALEILKRELKIQLIEQNRIKESEIQTLESKLKIAEEKKTNALNDLKNQATNKINSLNNELIKLKDEIKNQSLISELSLKNKISEAVTNLEKENSSLTNSIEKIKLEQSINEKTRAIIATHTFGYPQNLDKLEDIVKNGERKYGNKIWKGNIEFDNES